MISAHALLVPFPAQVHVIPLMELALCLVDNGYRITFVTTEPVFQRIVAASSPEEIGEMDRIRLVAVPDGLDPDEDRAGDFVRMMSSILRTMPESLEKLIMESKDDKNSDRGGDDDDEEEEITCMIVDGAMQFSLEVARKMRLQSAVFWPAAAALDVPRLIAEV